MAILRNMTVKTAHLPQHEDSRDSPAEFMLVLTDDHGSILEYIIRSWAEIDQLKQVLGNDLPGAVGATIPVTIG